MLTLSGISKAYGVCVLFEDATLQVNRQDRIGLVGPNGAGKTTLFSIILGEESADAGKVILEQQLPRHGRTGLGAHDCGDNDREKRDADHGESSFL